VLRTLAHADPPSVRREINRSAVGASSARVVPVASTSEFPTSRPSPSPSRSLSIGTRHHHYLIPQLDGRYDRTPSAPDALVLPCLWSTGTHPRASRPTPWLSSASKTEWLVFSDIFCPPEVRRQGLAMMAGGRYRQVVFFGGSWFTLRLLD
jgi:hypothetical protein